MDGGWYKGKRGDASALSGLSQKPQMELIFTLPRGTSEEVMSPFLNGTWKRRCAEGDKRSWKGNTTMP